MQYSFDVEMAEKIGVNEAIMLNNFVFWLKSNKANEKNFFDGSYWTYNSQKAFTELFPFWNELQIKRILKSLVEQGILAVGNYNKNPFDRTNWYSLTEEYFYLIDFTKTKDGAEKFDKSKMTNRVVKNDTIDKSKVTSRQVESDSSYIGTDINYSDIKQDIKNKLDKSNLQKKDFQAKKNKDFSFSLNKLTEYKNLSEEYKIKLKQEILNLNSFLSFEDFENALLAKGYKYKNFFLAYKAWINNNSKKTNKKAELKDRCLNEKSRTYEAPIDPRRPF